jgi:hypothetical protein
MGQCGEKPRNGSESTRQPPMMTVGQPGGMIIPVGLGIGATQDA